ncbi:CRISPR-associated helicase Cas3' [Acidipropionibacterium jensenii]|uniref:CRISPR-associated helicase Cas3' n=1 Tax=Acidipropionibacterium jensenii TaxID=1749 RepID=UPI001386AF70|nr:CRISPR-associated helicase Cas3' [Acidipropionibacterium jensenii]
MADQDPISLLWAKSDAGGHPHSLVGHLLDTAAVAEIIWDEFMAPITRRLLDQACHGHGRQTYVLICGLHDIGKASPAFQRKCPDLAAPIRDYLPLRLQPSRGDQQWHHTRAGARFLMELLDTRFPQAKDLRQHWVEVIVLGHHGKVMDLPDIKLKRSQSDEKAWRGTQETLVELLTRELEIPLSVLVVPPPSQSLQLELAGYVVMADWIASCSEFPGIGMRGEQIDEARHRARRAWKHLGFTPGWRPEALASGVSAFPQQFELSPRPLQRLAAEAALSIPEPGLMIIEAPMGEGKTEAGEFATEILARRFGCDGFIFAMPTQGTTDTMYQRVLRWNNRVEPDVPVTLLHGKAMLNEQWLKILHQDADELSDIYDDDPYGVTPSGNTRRSTAPSVWLLGRHRQLLSPLVVGTVDQILRAAVRAKFVMLRHAGLAGKVLIIDEVHSYDVYMSTFLHELLRWCAGAKIPVILMSATLPPALRDRLIASYTSKPVELAPSDSYPVITSVLPDSSTSQASCAPFRQDMEVSVEVLPTNDPDDVTPIVDAVVEESSEGGCILVILNTVKRAQKAYELLRDRGVPSQILHGRLTTGARADRTAELVDLLGDDRSLDSGRPHRLVVVATQIAEQSFDVDADMLFTDIAPIDLLLQRIGRVHRHIRPVSERPACLRTPRIIVTGLHLAGSGEPSWAKAIGYVYAPWTLLAASYQLREGKTGWSIPGDIPRLVTDAYNTDWEPDSGWPSVAETRHQQEAKESGRTSSADTFLLGGSLIPGGETLEGLHYQPAADDEQHPTVRDGEPTREICLVVRREDGYFSLDGRPLGPNGERCSNPDLARHVLGDCVRVRESEHLGDLRPLPAWRDIPLLAWQETLILDSDQQTSVDGAVVRYDDELGLVIDRGDR